MRNGRLVVSEWLAALCSCSGATIQTSDERARAISSNSLMPGDSIPSSLVTRMRALASSMRPSAIRFYDLPRSHIGLQRRGQRHRAVMALEVFEKRYQGPADRQAGAIEGMHRRSPLASGGTITRLHAMRLERAAVRAARDFAVRSLAGEPYLDVVSFLRGEPHIASRKQDHAIGKAEPPQHLLGTGGHPFVLGRRIFRPRDGDQLDFFELVLSNHAASVFSRRTSLRAEARSPGGVAQRQCALVEYLSGDQVGERHFGCRDQPIVVRGAELIRAELGELAGPEERLVADQQGRRNLGISELGRVKVEHELA